MSSPFITLTSNRGKRITVNINHIVHMEDQTYQNSTTRCTYISLTSAGTTSVHVRENYDHVMQLISLYYAE